MIYIYLVLQIAIISFVLIGLQLAFRKVSVSHDTTLNTMLAMCFNKLIGALYLIGAIIAQLFLLGVWAHA